MEATMVLEKPKISPSRPSARPARRPKIDTLEKFLQWKPEDGYKHEWNNGIIEKTPKMIIPQNFYIVQRLIRLFQKTNACQNGGELLTEPGTKTSATQLRIPDMAYYSKEQILAARSGTFPMPQFAIEFVSDNDTYKKVLKKLDEYYRAGAKIVWLIFPELARVYVYSSPRKVMICMDEDFCSAEPVLPGFKISANDMFA